MTLRTCPSHPQPDLKSPKPHRWTVWLTLATLVVGVFALMISRNAYEFNRNTAVTAAVQVTSVRLLTAARLETRQGAHFIEPIRLEVTFKSTGKLVADGVTVFATAETFFQKKGRHWRR